MSYPPGPGRYPPAHLPHHGPPTTNAKATASLVTGIATLVLSWCCGFGVAGVVAIVLGVKARNEIRASGGRQSGDGMALAGIITGACAIAFAVLVLALVIVAIATGTADYHLEPTGPGSSSL